METPKQENLDSEPITPEEYNDYILDLKRLLKSKPAVEQSRDPVLIAENADLILEVTSYIKQYEAANAISPSVLDSIYAKPEHTQTELDLVPPQAKGMDEDRFKSVDTPAYTRRES